MLTSVQLEKIEIAARTFGSAQGITMATVMLPEDVPSGSGSVDIGQKKGKKKPDVPSAAMVLFFTWLRRIDKPWPWDFQLLFIGVREAAGTWGVVHVLVPCGMPSLSEMRGCAKTSRQHVLILRRCLLSWP